MQTVDEQPETIHLYVVREPNIRPPIYPIVFSALALVTLVIFCSLALFQQPVTHVTLRVPAIPLPPQTFTAKMAIIPTGRKTYAATTAYGALTITNGSVISQTLPAGFRLGNVATDTAVFVPAGSADGYGVATVTAHALIPGSAGNISAYTINQVEGSSVYIRNMSAFRGGKDSYSVTVVTAHDRLTAQANARQLVGAHVSGLHYPCSEVVSISKRTVSVSWRCQFVRYSLPAYMHVTGVSIIGKNLLIHAWFVERPVYRSFK